MIFPVYDIFIHYFWFYSTDFYIILFCFLWFSDLISFLSVSFFYFLIIVFFSFDFFSIFSKNWDCESSIESIFYRCTWENERELGSRLGFKGGIEVAPNRQFSWTVVKSMTRSSVPNNPMNDTTIPNVIFWWYIADDQHLCSSLW